MSVRDANKGVTRRQFLESGAAVATGGLVIGISLTGCGDRPADVVSAPVAPKQDLEVRQNAWLSINTNGDITFFSPFSEMGQGVYTSIPMLLAEELEVPVWRIAVVDGGDGVLETERIELQRAGVLGRQIDDPHQNAVQ